METKKHSYWAEIIHPLFLRTDHLNSSAGRASDYLSKGSGFDPWLWRLHSLWQTRCLLPLFLEQKLPVTTLEWGYDNRLPLCNWNTAETMLNSPKINKNKETVNVTGEQQVKIGHQYVGLWPYKNGLTLDWCLLFSAWKYPTVNILR